MFKPDHLHKAHPHEPPMTGNSATARCDGDGVSIFDADISR